LPESTQNVRLTSEARPGTKVKGWRDACWLSGIFSFLVAFPTFFGVFALLDTEACKHRDKAQVWFKRLLGEI
jgi:hypothetical protein